MQFWSKDREVAISGVGVVERATVSPMHIEDRVLIADRLARAMITNELSVFSSLTDLLSSLAAIDSSIILTNRRQQ
jgi:hypothetical protein